MRWILLLVAVLAVSACASDPCTSAHSYLQARTVPPLKAPAGLETPAADPSMQIPAVPAGTPDFVYAVTDDAGKNVQRCLAVPPPLPAQANQSSPQTASRGG